MTRPPLRRLASFACAAAALAAAAGCAAVYRLGIGLYYDRVDLDESLIHRDVSYVRDGTDKQRLDLFVPASAGFPTVVFAHGGGWRDGDRTMEVGGADVYGNIGRLLATRGVGAAIISYRLQPAVRWQAQVDDVAAAAAWVHVNISRYGGRRDAIVLMGHSAGAHLAAHAVLDPARLAMLGVPRDALRGLIAVSGAGYDLADQKTYALGNDPAYYAARFADGSPGWQRLASPVTHISADDPAVLVMFATGETEPLKHQARLFHERLQAERVDSTLSPVRGYSHTRIVPALSRPDKMPIAAILEFIDRVTAAKTSR